MAYDGSNNWKIYGQCFMNMQSIIYLLHVISNHFNNIVLLAVIAISEKMRKAKQVVALGYKKKKNLIVVFQTLYLSVIYSEFLYQNKNVIWHNHSFFSQKSIINFFSFYKSTWLAFLNSVLQHAVNHILSTWNMNKFRKCSSKYVIYSKKTILI